MFSWQWAEPTGTCQPGGVLKAETLKNVSRKIGDEEILGSQHPAFGQCFKQFLDGSCKVSSEFLAVHICIVADLALIAAQTGIGCNLSGHTETAAACNVPFPRPFAVSKSLCSGMMLCD